MNNTVQSGPAQTAAIREKYDFTRFDQLMAKLQEWRGADHEDNIVLCRSDVIEIIEGAKAIAISREAWRFTAKCLSS